ncbi:zinc-binding dehydrogenase [Azotobacter sp. CWF10]
MTTSSAPRHRAGGLWRGSGRARARAGAGGVDVVADFVGGVREQTLAVLRQGSRRHGSIIDDSVREAGGLYVWVRPSGQDLQVLADMAAGGRLEIPVARVFPLEQAADALRLNQTGHVRGKVIVRVSR